MEWTHYYNRLGRYSKQTVTFFWTTNPFFHIFFRGSDWRGSDWRGSDWRGSDWQECQSLPRQSPPGAIDVGAIDARAIVAGAIDAGAIDGHPSSINRISPATKASTHFRVPLPTYICKVCVWWERRYGWLVGSVRTWSKAETLRF